MRRFRLAAGVRGTERQRPGTSTRVRPGEVWQDRHLALPCLALPCLALPCLALPCLALPCLFLAISFYLFVFFVFSLPYLALPCLLRAPPCSLLCILPCHTFTCHDLR
ncbi:hypothetical protein FFI39_007115 [Janthinobacterium sp. KBS0711]|nr:hypothetical protein FFI39_007115 [Janthinobacterium sp. KBS0711]